MRSIDTIIIHCAYTPPSMDIGAEEIRSWHVDDRKWSDIGYHYVLRRNGFRESGRPIHRVGAHAKGHNGTSIGICLVGGQAEDKRTPECNFTDEQWQELEALVLELCQLYDIERIIGHRDVAPGRACPTFDVGVWAAGLNIPES